MRMPRVVWRLALAGALLPAGGTALADDEGHILGVSVGYSTLFERPFGSLDFLMGIDPHFAIVPTVSYVETGGIHRWTAGVELQWHPPIEKLHPKLLGWVGGGLNVLTEDPKGPQEATTRDLVVDAVAGVGWDAPACPFIQMRVTFKDPADVGLAIGVRF